MKNKHKYPRFKFIHRPLVNVLSIDDLRDDFIEVDNPLPYNNLPNGEYQIRGNKKNHAKYYYVKDNHWFLTEDKIKDNGHYMTESATYQLFKPLSDKEYLNLKKCYKFLNKHWRRNVLGYFFWKELRETKRNSRFVRYKIIGR